MRLKRVASLALELELGAPSIAAAAAAAAAQLPLCCRGQFACLLLLLLVFFVVLCLHIEIFSRRAFWPHLSSVVVVVVVVFIRFGRWLRAQRCQIAAKSWSTGAGSFYHLAQPLRSVLIKIKLHVCAGVCECVCVYVVLVVVAQCKRKKH